ncbi:MAG: hypothetical protein ACTSVR_12140, partial [Candidatus Thorarchaeota archaeon]
DTVLITVNERALINHMKSLTDDPSVLTCVQVMASSGLFDWFTWTNPVECYSGNDILENINHYRIQYECDVPDSNLTIFVQSASNQRFRLYPVLHNGQIGCAPDDTSWTGWLGFD